MTVCVGCGADATRFRLVTLDGKPRCRRCHTALAERLFGELDRAHRCRTCRGLIEVGRVAKRCLDCSSQRRGSSSLAIGGYHRDGAASMV